MTEQSEQPERDTWFEDMNLVVKVPQPGETFQVVLTGALADWFRNEVEARGMELAPIPTREGDLPTMAVFPRTETA